MTTRYTHVVILHNDNGTKDYIYCTSKDESHRRGRLFSKQGRLAYCFDIVEARKFGMLPKGI